MSMVIISLKLFFFGFVFIYINDMLELILVVPHLTASAKRQTHTRGFGAGKSTGVVCRNLCRPTRICQITLVVHNVTVRNVVFGARGVAARLSKLNAAGDRHVRTRDGSSSTKGGVQSHFIIYVYSLFLYDFSIYFYISIFLIIQEIETT